MQEHVLYKIRLLKTPVFRITHHVSLGVVGEPKVVETEKVLNGLIRAL